VCLKVPGNILWVIIARKLADAGAILFKQSCFMVDRTKQPAGYIRISEKCVFTLKSLLRRYGDGFIRATVFSQELFLNLISFQENAARRAVGESRAEVFSMKKNKSTLVFPQRSALCFCLCFFLMFFIFWGIIAQLKFIVF